jgi:hypothetical protein
VRRQRPLLLSAFIALTAALAFGAPLFHAHLDAAHAVAQGQLCGEHPPADGSNPSGGYPCSLCLASAHASAALVRVTPLFEGPARSSRAVSGHAQTDHSVDVGASGAPRAPPLSG